MGSCDGSMRRYAPVFLTAAALASSAFVWAQTTPADLRAGSRVSVRYHPTGSTGQVADEFAIIASQRSGDTRR